MVGKPEFTGVETLVLRVSLFLNPERAQDVQPKFAYEIVATSNCRLRQNVVCAALPNVVLPGWAFPRFARLSALHSRRFDGQSDSRTLCRN